MKIIQMNSKYLLNRFLIVQSRRYSTEFYPYTTELYKKNYIKYPTQSRSAIQHDYVFDNNERLPSLKERLKEFRDPVDDYRTNIGKQQNHPKLEQIQKEMESVIKKNKQDKSLELKSKDLKIDIPLEKIERDIKIISSFRFIQKLADFYNINKDLFANGYFRPVIDLTVQYKNENNSHGVYYGNKLSAKFTSLKPKVTWEDLLECNKKENVYHSLMFVNLDGNFNDSNKEVVLWFVANIKNGKVNDSEELIDYVQPFPMRGTGWHRCVYVLFEHESPVNFKLPPSKHNFHKRAIKMSEFYLNHQDSITPVGLSFFQTEWDLSVRNVFHDYLNMKDPVYEYDFGTRFVPKFEKYPLDQPFNWYLQEYMDKAELNETVFKNYIKDLSPFEPYPEPEKYPLLDVNIVKPKWYKYELESMRKRRHQYSLIPFKYSSPIKKIKEEINNLPYQQ